MRISFKAVKEHIPLKEVAAGYGIQLRQVGAELIGPCPLHKGDNPTAFHLNAKKNRWTCFTHCGYGDVIDFVARFEKCSLKNAALVLAENYAPELIPSQHPFLTERNFDNHELLQHFGLKYQQGGLWHGMITIPLHDMHGSFVGYLGRRVTNLKCGKYKIQKGIKRSRLLFNLHRVDVTATLFIVEGPFDVLRLFQAGYANTVALLGSQLSEFQYTVLKNTSPVLLLDQDVAGYKAASQMKQRLPHAIQIDLPAKDPAAMTSRELKNFLEGIL